MKIIVVVTHNKGDCYFEYQVLAQLKDHETLEAQPKDQETLDLLNSMHLEYDVALSNLYIPKLLGRKKLNKASNMSLKEKLTRKWLEKEYFTSASHYCYYMN